MRRTRVVEVAALAAAILVACWGCSDGPTGEGDGDVTDAGADGDSVGDAGADGDADGDLDEDEDVIDGDTDGGGPAPVWPLGEIELYADEFESLLALLMERYWDESGDWGGDMMGDATTFAAATLFPVGHARDDAEMSRRAEVTARYEQELLIGFISEYLATGDASGGLEAVSGGPALTWGYWYTGDEELADTLGSTLELASSLIAGDPELLADYFDDPAVLLAMVAYAVAFHIEVTGHRSLVTWLVRLLSTAREGYYDEEGRYYGPRLWDWGQTTMMIALAGAYAVTGEEEYHEHSDELLDETMISLWDVEEGGLTSVHFHLDPSKVLSGNNALTTAMLEWWRVTGDERYRELAERSLEFLFTGPLWDGEVLWHHWTPGEGRADYFCTGCWFHTLANLVRYSQLVLRDEG